MTFWSEDMNARNQLADLNENVRLTEIGCEGGVKIELAQDRVQWLLL
jgi:hypothetical protein